MRAGKFSGTAGLVAVIVSVAAIAAAVPGLARAGKPAKGGSDGPRPFPLSAIGQASNGGSQGGNCPNVTCNDAQNLCTCVTASGSIIGSGIGKSSFSFELSAAQSLSTTEYAQQDGGSTIPGFGYIHPTTGIGTITLPGKDGDSINLFIQGTLSDVYNLSANKGGFSGSYLINGGTGHYANAQGAGSCAIGFDYTTGATSISLNGSLVN